MSKKIHATSLTIVRSTHLARDAVLFTLFSVATVVFYPSVIQAYEPLLWFILDFLGLFFLWTPRETLQKVGLGWGGLMSLVLLFPVFYYSGRNEFIGGVIVLLLFCIVEMLAVLKITYDVIKAEARSWTENTEIRT